MDISSPVARAVARLVVAILHCFLDRYRDLIDLFKLAMGPMFYFGSHGGRQMFRPVDLGRLRAQPQPSARDSFPLDTCGFLQRKGQKGALVAVCTPTLKSASMKHQKLCTSVSEHRVWHSEGGKKENCV